MEEQGISFFTYLTDRMKDVIIEVDNSINGYLNPEISFDEFMDGLRTIGYSYVTRSTRNYTIESNQKKRGLKNRKPSAPLEKRIHFFTPRRSSFHAKIEFFGSPFIILHSKILHCVNGPCDMRPKRKIDKHNMEKEVKTRVRLYSKKLGCPAKMYVRCIRYYPEYEITEDINESERLMMVNALREAMDTGTEIKCIERIYIEATPEESHLHSKRKNEVSQSMHPKLIQEIYRLVGEGFDSLKDVKLLLECFTNRMFENNPTMKPTLLNNAFYPSDKDIRSHIYYAKNYPERRLKWSALAKNCDSVVKKEPGTLDESIVKEEKTDDSNELLKFHPASKEVALVSGESILAASELCRTCMASVSPEEGEAFDLNHFVVYESDSSERSVIKLDNLVTTMTSVTIEEKDNMPNKICSSCFNKLMEFYIFRLNCIKTDLALVQLATNPEIIIPDIMLKCKTEGGQDANETATEIAEDNDLQTRQDQITNEKHQTGEEMDVQQSDVLIESEEPTLEVERPGDYSSTLALLEELKRRKREEVVCKENKHFMCHICGKQSNTDQALSIHLTSHSLMGSFQCPQCPKYFSLERYMDKHVKNVHSLIDRFVCNHCSATFTRKDSLRAHINSHKSFKKQFSCHQCRKKFSTQGSLLVHKKTHPKDLLLCPQCNKEFFHRKSFLQHLRTHGEIIIQEDVEIQEEC